MTSFGTSSFCALCGKQSGSTSCDGCQRKFCFECLSEHRRELSLEFDELINRRNELFETINNHTSNNTTGKCPCFDEIDRWQTEMRANVDRIASTARDNVRQFLSEASKNVRNELDQVSKDLQQRQKTGGYVEGDLNRIKQQLTKLNDTVQRLNEQIHIDTSTSKRIDWDSLLFVVPNKESQINTMSTIVSQTPNSNTFPNQSKKNLILSCNNNS
jgi:DNA repair exonuclease SbcCD ATPase subunit